MQEAWFLQQWNFQTCAKMGQMYQCAWWLCYKNNGTWVQQINCILCCNDFWFNFYGLKNLIYWLSFIVQNQLWKKEQLEGSHKSKLQQSLTHFPMFIFLEPLCSVLTSTILLQKLAVIHLVYKCNGMISCSSYEYPHAVLKNFFSEHFWFPGSHVCTISFVRNIAHFKCKVNPPPPTNTHTQTHTHTHTHRT